MKRFYKFLMPLVAIVALALPVNLAAQTTCTIKIVGEDSYGDAWNGGSLAVVQGTTTVTTFTAPNSDNDGEGDGIDSTTVTVQSGIPVSFNWTSGSYDSEVTIRIYHSSGVLLYSVTSPSAGVLFTLADPCSSCFAPSALDVSNLGSDEVTLTWSGDATSYGIEWGTTADMEAGSGTTTTASTNTITLTGLTASTSYTFNIWSDCGSETSDTATLTFATLGDAVSVFPYTTGFEPTDDTAWTFVNNTTNKWFIGSAVNNGGSRSLYISNNDGTANAYTLSSTQFSYAYRVLNITDAGQYAVSFDWKANGESNYDYLRAWIAPASAVSSLTAGQAPNGSTSASSYTTATPEGWFDLGGKMNLKSTWQTALGLPQLAAGNYILLFMWANDGSSGSQPPAAVDNIDIHILSCYLPTALNILNLDSTSFTFAWSAGSDESNWEVRLNNEAWIAVTDTTYDFTGLDDNTDYTVSVRAICGSGDTSFINSVSTHTPCSYMIDTLPFTCSFESSTTGTSTTFNFGEPCWVLNTDATEYPYVYVGGSSYAHTGSKGIYWYRSTSTGTYGSYQCLVLPTVNTANNPINTLQLKFWAKASSASYHPEFQVGVMTNPNDINSFVLVNTINVEGTTWTEYEALLGSYTGTGRFVAIRSNVGTSAWYAYVDDITLDLMPACPHPVDLVVDSVSTEDIYLHWSAIGTETSWLVTLNDSIIADATDTTYTISGLTLNTPYTISVAALCSNGDTSDAISVNTRTLAGDPISNFPYFCNFEIDEEGMSHANDWVLENGNQPNYWIVGTATSLSGTRSMYITNDGNTNTYNGSESYVFAYATFLLDTGNYAYSFDWKCQGESSFDFLRAAVVPNTVEFTAGSYNGFNNTSSVPAGGIAIDGANRLNLQGSWLNRNGDFSITTPGVYKMVFMWRNDGSVFNQPPAAIDNVMLVRLTCPKPTNLHATYVGTDTVTLAWNPGGSENSWVVSDGFNSYVVNDTTYTFEDLSPSTLYNFTVQAVCSDEDSSLFTTLNVRTQCGMITSLPLVEDFENTGSTSSSSNAFIPCWTKVCNGTSYLYPYVSNSTTYNHTSGGNFGLYWYRSSTSGSYGDYNIIVLPQIDTVALPLNTTMLSFWAKASGSSYTCNFQIGAMPHPDSVAQFVNYQTVTVTGTEWQKYTVIFNNLSEIDTVGCSYIAIRSNNDGNSWYAYVDDITLDSIPDCSPVEEITVNAGVTSAVVSWTNLTDADGAVVEYRDAETDSWTTVSVTGQTYAILTGLTPETNYDVRVANVCGETNSSFRSSTMATGGFPCAQFDSTSMINVTVGTGSTTNSYIPSTSYYNYGYSQQIFKASEIGQSGVLTSVTLTPSTIVMQRTYEIYMAQTSDSTATTFLNPSGMTCVYNGGAINLEAGVPVTFNLTTPFNYSNSSNLLLVFRDMTGSYVSGNAWQGDAAWDGASRYIYQDAGAYTPGAVSDGTSSNFRNKVTFFGGSCLQASTCAAPLPIVTDITTTTVDVVWAPGNVETSWNVYYRNIAHDDNFTFAGTASTNSYHFTGLTSGMPHEFMIVPVCTDSLSATVRATTECASISSLPLFENFNNWGSGSGVIPNCWYRTGNSSTYSYISTSYNMSGASGGSIYMYQSGSSHSAIFLPELDTNVYQANQTQLVFHAMNSSSSYLHPGFEVGVLTDPTDITTFVPVDTVYHTAGPNVWEIFEVSLAGYTGNGAYVGLRTTDNPASGTEYTYTYFYLDDVTLELIPTCPRPDSLTASNATTTTVELGWHERGGASSWIIEYGPAGFQLGTGTVVAATSNPFTLTGLPAAYQGEYYVRSVCSSTDTGDYSRRPCAFGTSQIPATLPYDYDFETAGEWSNWQTSTNHATANWYRGTDVADSSTYSMYVANNDTGYFDYSFNAVVNAAIYRDIDFGPIDSSYTISFSARVGGTTTNSYDGLMVFLVDPSIAPVASSSNITSPWGNVNDLYRIATVRLDTTWQTYEASFDTISGIHRVAFFWFNQNTGASYNNIPQPAAVDNIHIQYSTCPRPLELEATPGSTTAVLTWRGASSASYEVTYRKVGGSNQSVFTNTNSITLTDLESNSDYRAWVRKVCNVGDSSLYSDGVAFNTTLCEGGTEAANFTGTSTSTTSYGPIGYCLYNYSYVQTIIDSADLVSLSGDITAFAFLPTNTTSSDYYNGMTVYMANVSESDLESGFIMPNTTNHVFHKVIDSASFNFTTTDWQIHNLDTAFTWDGHSNLLIAVTREHGTWGSSGSFSAHTASASKMRYVYQDASAYDINTVTGGTASNTVGDIRLISCGGTIVCDEPVIANVDTTETTITFNWTGSAASYEVAIVPGAWTESLGTAVTDTFYTFTVLDAWTNYTIGVRAVCGATYSEWVTLPVTTLRHPCAMPTGLQVTNPTFDGATISWTAGEAENQWEVNISQGSVFSQTYTVTDNPTLVVTGLSNGQTYDVKVRAVCAADWASDWTATVELTTETCVQVTGVTASNLTATTATITWTSTGAPSYEIEYGTVGFVQGSGQMLTSTTNSVNITGLEADTRYDIFVRGVCTEGVNSLWSTKYTFRTEEVEGIDEVENGNVTLFPNPASTMVTVSGIEGMSTVTVVDLNGREVYKTNADNTLTIDVSSYAKGAYFVRITGERTTAVRKLIVK